MQSETDYNVLKQERIEYENAYNKILNELNEYKLRNEEMDDVKETLQLVVHSSSIINDNNVELSNNYDDLNKKYKNMENNYKNTLNELSELKTLNNDLKSVNDSYLKINDKLKQRNTKTEAELGRLRNYIIELETELNNITNNGDTNNTIQNTSHIRNHTRNLSVNVKSPELKDTTAVNNILKYHKATRTPALKSKAGHSGVFSPSIMLSAANIASIFDNDTNDFDLYVRIQYIHEICSIYIQITYIH